MHTVLMKAANVVFYGMTGRKIETGPQWFIFDNKNENNNNLLSAICLDILDMWVIVGQESIN